MNSSRLQEGILAPFGTCVAVIIATALACRIVSMVIFHTWTFEDQWMFGWEMGRIGQWLAEGHGFTLNGVAPTARFPPAYAYLVAGVFSLFGVYSSASAITLFLFQSVCAAVSAALLAVLGSHFFNRTVGLVAGFAWAIYPTSFHYSIGRIWYCELSVMLLLAIIIISVKSEPKISRILYSGTVSGLAILVDTTLAVYLFFLCAWWIQSHRLQLSRTVTAIVIWIGTVVMVMSPWMIRNWEVFDSPIWGKSGIGIELFIGNNDSSINLTYRDRSSRVFNALDSDELEYYRQQPENIYFNYLGHKALEWIRNHPIEFAEKTAFRVAQFWFSGPYHVLSYYGFMGLIALISLWHDRDRWWQLTPIWLFLVVYPLPYYVTFAGNLRYRHPTEPLIVLLAAYSLARWFEFRAFHFSLARARDERPTAAT